MKVRTLSTANQICLFNASIDRLDASIFEPPTDSATNTAGRGTANFIEREGRMYVLKPYCRGGMAQRMSRDLYFYTGLQRTRAVREFDLLMRMRELRLPVPEPVAAQIVRVRPLRYRACLVTAKIDVKASLGDYLAQRPLTNQGWQQLADMLRRFHRHGVCHVDLNAQNVLIDQLDRFHLIDFDRCGFRSPARHWNQRNLQRLKRSLQKQALKHPQYHFSDREWDVFLRAYMANLAKESSVAP